MFDFVDRQAELDTLNKLLDKKRSQFIIVYGRRRVGKTTLLRHWVAKTQLPHVYWVARREPTETVKHSMARAFWRSLGAQGPPRFDNWEDQFEAMALHIGQKPMILIFDEFPYAAESDPSLPSHLQAAWDLFLQDKPVILILAGSHIGMMVDLMGYQAPLYGRFSAQFPLNPLPFAVLADLFPNYSAAERVAIYAVLGGIPGYLNLFDGSQSIGANIRQQLLQSVGMFRSEPLVLISDLIREPRNYESVLRAVASGFHTLTEIAEQTGLPTTHIPSYLKRLIELRLVERRIPATLPPKQRRSNKRGRYYLRDPFLRFHYRFVEPNLEMIEFGEADVLWQRLREQFRAFVGATAWEELCREWVISQANRKQMPFPIELVGSHWSKDAQVDVIAINWRDKAILLGECKWGDQPVGQAVIHELANKAPSVVPAEDWRVWFAFFARKGFTPAARTEAKRIGALLVDLDRLDRDLRQAMLETD
jgi:AAA+ ATPase superfamily predicted ATPase